MRVSLTPALCWCATASSVLLHSLVAFSFPTMEHAEDQHSPPCAPSIPPAFFSINQFLFCRSLFSSTAMVWPRDCHQRPLFSRHLLSWRSWWDMSPQSPVVRAPELLFPSAIVRPCSASVFSPGIGASFSFLCRPTLSRRSFFFVPLISFHCCRSFFFHWCPSAPSASTAAIVPPSARALFSFRRCQLPLLPKFFFFTGYLCSVNFCSCRSFFFSQRPYSVSFYSC